MTDIEYLKKYLPAEKLDEGLQKLKAGEPVQYIVGNVNFHGNIINVNQNVLIPRFETELLVDKAASYIKQYFQDKVKILDIGTGSGAIAITLKKLLNCNVDGVDISNKALDVAKNNAALKNVSINFFESDVFTKVNDKYDVIISNPPYISLNEPIDDLVKNNEPAIALFANHDGLEFYEKILSEASNYLNKKAFIAFEIGEQQGDKIKQIALEYFPNATITIEKDFPGKDRFIFIFIEDV